MISFEGDGDGLGNMSDVDGEPYEDEVGSARAGRLAEDSDADGARPHLCVADVGVNGAAASAEEAAVSVIP